MQAFLNKKTTIEEFHDDVFGLRRKSIVETNEFLSKLTSGEIKEFVPNKEANRLEGFLSGLYFQCEGWDDDGDDERFHNAIRNGFLKFQKILNEE